VDAKRYVVPITTTHLLFPYSVEDAGVKLIKKQAWRVSIQGLERT
jgi:hypothetical protein